MSRIKPTLAIFFSTYAALVALFFIATRGIPDSAPIVWYVWAFFGALCLATIALEITLLVLWLWMKFTRFSADAGVPLRLSDEDRAFLDRTRPTVALLMPAHYEASNEADRDALADRIYGTLLKTPDYCSFFLLCDSPDDQRDNERDVVREVRRRLRSAGLEHHAERVALEEYRDKPADWRHKCGSILRWIQRHGANHEFMFILDADSSLMEEDSSRPQTCDVVERMTLAMLRDDNLAMVQAAMHLKEYRSVWGWLQSVNAKVGTAYYVPLFSYVYGRNTPCYGHNCLFRVRAFAEHCRNTLYYTSHDHMDAADLAAAGYGCVMTDAALTYEEPEDDLLLWLKRECRWSRGNGQWFTYLFRKRGLPLSAIVFLVIGIAQYLWAVVALVFFIAAVALVPGGGYDLVTRIDSSTAVLLITIVMSALLLPRLLARPRVLDFLGAATISLLIGPAVMIWQGTSFLLGAFGTAWVPRGARTNAFDLPQMLRIAKTLFPIAVLGFLLWRVGRDAPIDSWAGTLIRISTIAMVLSPLTGILLSWPLFSDRESPAAEPSTAAHSPNGAAVQ